MPFETVRRAKIFFLPLNYACERLAKGIRRRVSGWRAIVARVAVVDLPRSPLTPALSRKRVRGFGKFGLGACARGRSAFAATFAGQFCRPSGAGGSGCG